MAVVILKKSNKKIESYFSSLNDLKVEENTIRTSNDLQTYLGITILDYNLQL